MARREALLICSETFSDVTFRRLRSPSVDVSGLAAVLEDKAIGGFHVEQMIDRPCHDVRRTIEEFYQDRELDDLLLLYLSGHGHRDMFGRLYFICTDTEIKHLKATALPSSFISEIAQESKSRRQVLIIDSCFSGAFIKGMSLKSSEHSLTGNDFPSGGRGQVIFTASTAFQYSLEGNDVLGEAQPSLFTKHLIDGLTSGDADLNNDGIIDLDELYQYLHARTTQEAHQTPQRWALQMEGVIAFASNQKPRKGQLPGDVQELLEHSHPGVRLHGVEELKRLLGSGRPGIVLTANEELQRLAASDDSQRIREAASIVLRSRAPQPQKHASTSTAERSTLQLEGGLSAPEVSQVAPSDVAQRSAGDLGSAGTDKWSATPLFESVDEQLAQEPEPDTPIISATEGLEEEANWPAEMQRPNVSQMNLALLRAKLLFKKNRNRILQILIVFFLIATVSPFLPPKFRTTESLIAQIQAGNFEFDTLLTLAHHRELTNAQAAKVAEYLARILRNGDQNNRFDAVLYIGTFDPDGRYAGDVAKVLDDENTVVAQTAVEYLAAIGEQGRPFIPNIAELLKSTDAGKRRSALVALTKFGPEALQPYLSTIKEMLSDPDPRVQKAAKEALSKS